MCELLVRREHAPVNETPGRWKSGYVIDVKPDGHRWGRLESKDEYIKRGGRAADWHNRTVIIKFPGTPVEKFLDYLEDDHEVVEETIGSKQVTVRYKQRLNRRAKQIDMKRLPKSRTVTEDELRLHSVDLKQQRLSVST